MNTFDDLMLYMDHQKQEKQQEKHRRAIEAIEVIKRAEELIQELKKKPALSLLKEYREKEKNPYYVATKNLDYVPNRKRLQDEVDEAKDKFESYLARHYKDTRAYSAYHSVYVQSSPYDGWAPAAGVDYELENIELSAEERDQLYKLHGIIGELWCGQSLPSTRKYREPRYPAT